ncbi:class III extradiol dioxygenase subunit B-like domain-containing protein [Rhodococcus qingshengii]|uniref:class III extradiol dioxygenase subunit B-like domain-containing protein n=1 Tax=Rhodococcus TaxID=1827 RepID=UPI001BABF569|nr:class III extradiol dioxygenase subunit B-like domain-containing protein [Rhodococcus qingshengii]MBS3690004.1 class III extradiol dioxygenase subunit B-like domain-containing protein [Rhodococcus qingshengii]
MLTSAVLVPSAPLLVPELSGDSAESAQVRATAIAAVRRLSHEAVHWVGVGVGLENAGPKNAAGELWRSGVGRGQIGTFAGFGADVRTSLDADAAGEPVPSLELCALVAGWLRGRTDVEITVDMHVVSAKASANECREFGQQLRKQLDSDNRPQGLLIVADGASTLTAKAPGSFDERAAGVQSAIDDALTAGDPEALLALDPRLCRSVGAQGRAAWQVLAGVFTGSSRSAHPRATVDYSDAPFGVGYHVGTWRP